MARFIFLMRHAEQERGNVTRAGVKEIAAVADRFSGWLSSQTIVLDWYCTSDSEVRQTASLLYRDISATPEAGGGRMLVSRHFADAGDGGALPSGIRDDPLGFGAYQTDSAEIESLLNALNETSKEHVAPLLVGNDPLITWLASELSNESFAVARGELVCLEEGARGRRWHPLWTIDPNGDAGYDAITSKIDSKMNSAKALGAVITGLLIFLIQNVVRDRPVWLDWVALWVLASSAGLYFAALFLYDGLLMPPRYWASMAPVKPPQERMLRVVRRVRTGRPGLGRPPSSAARVLQQAMLRIWNRVFVPATAALGLGIVLLIIAAPMDARRAFVPDGRAYAGAALWLLLLVGWVSANRPKLGVAD